MNRTIWVLITAFLLTIGRTWAASPNNSEPPGGIRLLPGYHYSSLGGIDSIGGSIKKDGGLTLEFDLPYYAGGPGGGSGVNEEISHLKAGEFLWVREQIINGQSLRLALTKQRKLYIAFRTIDAGFWGTANTEEDVTDALLMVLTYQPPPKRTPAKSSQLEMDSTKQHKPVSLLLVDLRSQQRAEETGKKLIELLKQKQIKLDHSYRGKEILLTGIRNSSRNPLSLLLPNSHVVGIVYLQPSEVKPVADYTADTVEVETWGRIRKVDPTRQQIEIDSLDTTVKAAD